MPQNTASQFLSQVETIRDALWSEGLRAGSAKGAEAEVFRRVREAFANRTSQAITADSEVTEAMPADVWARLCAAIQIDAAQQMGGKAVHLEGTSMPDPVLAPKKHVIKRDPEDMMNLSPAGRFLLGAGLVLIAGLWFTLYLRNTDRAISAATRAASQPTTQVHNENAH